ncbi:MAG: zinc ABC transporter substrate-binding protein [Aquificae bacterium]|nr:zinc ABC transporter substrate-binding protein [Aquificota bacterium]
MRFILIIFSVLSIFLVSFSRPVIVSSIKPISDIVKAVGGDKVEAHYVIPPQASVHFYEYKISDIKLIYEADLFLYIGVGEPNLEKITRTKAKGEVIKLINLKDLNLIYKFEFEHNHSNEENHKNPHPAIWLDPINAKIIAKHILSKLRDLDPENMYYYQTNFEKFSKEVDTVLKYGTNKFSTLRNRYFISYHYTWPYFTKRFGLIYLDVIELGHGREPTAKHILNIIKQINRFKIKAIFASVQFYNKKYTDLIIRSTNVKVVLLDPFGIDKTYIQMIKYNIDKIYDNLE